MWVLNEIVRPISHRLGTLVGTALASYGMAEADIQTVVAAGAVLVGFAADLIIRRIL